MKRIQLLAVYSTLLLMVGINAFGQANTKVNGVKKGFAVLELFTSEGCSSCPPADALMGRIQEEYKNDEVYVLAYHVDYWDQQGWKDIFSSADYTKRQYQYADWMGKTPVYTPQLVVNGKTELIGSQATEVKLALKKALSVSGRATVLLKASTTKNSLNVNYSVTGASKDSRFLLAVVQKSAQSKVKRGENEGRTLSHYQIVRQLHSLNIPQGGNGSIKLQLPDNFNTKNFEVVGFIQDTKNGYVQGVAKAIF
jgi:hypothetical protein